VPNLRREPADSSRGLLVLGEDWSNGFDSRYGKFGSLEHQLVASQGPCASFFSTSNDAGKKSVYSTMATQNLRL